jgi:hypothetical protein
MQQGSSSDGACGAGLNMLVKRQASEGSAGWQSWVWMFVFLAAVSPSILSYKPYVLMWDEAYYAHRIACMNREFYGFNVRGMANCLAGTHKSPAIELVGLLWGPAGATETGIGLSFVGLALLILVFVLVTYGTCIRAGFAPWHVALAGAVIGLAPLVRENGGALMTDILVAWCSALTVLLIALEFRTQDDAPLASFLRGGTWALVLTAGSLAKMTYGVFAAASIPILLFARWRLCGRRALLLSVSGLLTFAIPGILVWILCGPAMIDFGLRSAFGEVGALWGVAGMNAPAYLWRFFGSLGFAWVPLLLLFSLFLRGVVAEKMRLIPVAIVLVYLLIAAMGKNREERYTLTVVVALPLALCWTGYRPARAMRLELAQFLAGLLAGFLLAVPMSARPRLTAVHNIGELLRELSNGEPSSFVIATDGPEYNIETFQLARQVGGPVLQPIRVDTLVYDAVNKGTVEDGCRRMAAADYTLFLRPEIPAGPSWTRQWASQYRACAERDGTLVDSQRFREFDVFKMKKP